MNQIRLPALSRLSGSFATGCFMSCAMALFFGSLSIGSHAETAAIDTNDALTLGSFKISAYRVEKNFSRYANTNHRPDQRPPTPTEVSEWFSRFLSQQVLITAALRQGYGDRREVTAEIDRMERHMLSQPVGPLYEKLRAARPDPASDASLAQIYEKLEDTFEVEVLRLPQSAPVARALRQALAGLSPAEWDAPLAAAKSSGEAEFYAGTSQWPHLPFEEIAPAIDKVSANGWQQVSDEEHILFYRVLQRRVVKRPPLETIAPVLRVTARQMADRDLQDERRRHALRNQNFVFDWSVATQMARRLHELRPDPAQLLHLTALAELGPLRLAQYGNPDSSLVTCITVADYCRYHNDLFIRRTPGTALELYRGCQDLLVTQFDCTESRALGLDQEPKFREDRENYRNYLALELYEKEHIRPKLNVTDEQIATYYRDNQGEYSRPVRVAGRLLSFARPEEAQVFVEGTLARQNPFPVQSQAIEDITLASESIVPDLPALASMVFASPIPAALGPFPRKGSYVVWLTEKVMESATTPLASAAPDIRLRLENLLLPAFESELARSLTRNLRVDDRIDYRKFGGPETIVKPWSS